MCSIVSFVLGNNKYSAFFLFFDIQTQSISSASDRVVYIANCLMLS